MPSGRSRGLASPSKEPRGHPTSVRPAAAVSHTHLCAWRDVCSHQFVIRAHCLIDFQRRRKELDCFGQQHPRPGAIAPPTLRNGCPSLLAVGLMRSSCSPSLHPWPRGASAAHFYASRPPSCAAAPGRRPKWLRPRFAAGRVSRFRPWVFAPAARRSVLLGVSLSCLPMCPPASRRVMQGHVSSPPAELGSPKFHAHFVAQITHRMRARLHRYREDSASLRIASSHERAPSLQRDAATIRLFRDVPALS